MSDDATLVRIKLTAGVLAIELSGMPAAVETYFDRFVILVRDVLDATAQQNQAEIQLRLTALTAGATPH